MTANELRAKRSRLWEETKAFLESHRNENGTVSAEDDAAYSRMEQEITDLGKEITRLERQEEMDMELSKPLNTPITEKPMQAKENAELKSGRFSDNYKKAFWNGIRMKEDRMPYEIRNALTEGTDSEGGYLVPDEFENTLVQGLAKANVIRDHAHVITTSNGIHKIPVVASHGSAAWLDEGTQYTEGDEVFGQVNLDAHKSAPLSRCPMSFLPMLPLTLKAISMQNSSAESVTRKRTLSSTVTAPISLPVFSTPPAAVTWV